MRIRSTSGRLEKTPRAGIAPPTCPRAWLLGLLAALWLALPSCGPRGARDDGDPHGPPPSGTPCATAADCGGSRPACVDGRCAPCRDDGDCAGRPDCRVCDPGGACLRATGCCRGDLDCPASFACDRAPGAPTGRCADEEELR